VTWNVLRPVVIAAVSMAILAGIARAEFPFVAAPTRCDSSGNPAGCIPLPNEMTGAAGSCSDLKWKYASTNFCTIDPLVSASPNELFGVSGMSVDTAWRLSTGRSDVVIAVHDSGIRWSDPAALADLRAKFHLNAGELPPPGGPCSPPPGGDPRDCNGDGVFNMPDYDADPAVADLNGNGVKDPEDLILAFSDGVDGDGNGYVDDIAGWDFFEFDNDPFDDVAFGHGTGEARDSTAEANNGGGVGTCPNCMVMPVRVGDSFVADVNSFAQGVVFSVDTGADVIQEALGTYNNSTFGREAVAYAYRHDVPVVASAADEDSWHHNFPSAYAHTIVVNSIRDFGAPGGAPVVPNSWLFFNGCTNFGGNVAVSVPSTSCSSEATGRAAGLAGLLVSAGRDAVEASTLATPLTANEVRQLLTQTADDIDFETPPGTRAVSFPDTIRYATQPGWDQFTGYGRVNIRSAVARVAAGDIPPEAELDAPDWFTPLYPERDGSFVVRGRVAAARASAYTWRVQIGYGIQPQETDWIDVVPFGTPATVPVDGVLATIAPGQIPAPTPAQVARRVAQQPDVTSDYDRFTYTIRVQVRDQPGNRLGEDRRTIFVVDDPDLKAGFPLRIGGDGASSPAIADLDGDGAGEIVYGTSDGLVHATRADGSELPGWPVAGDPIPANPGSAAFVSGALALPVRGAILASVAVGDIDGDGRLDVVAADMEGKVYAWNDAGARKPGFPVQVNLLYSSHAVKNPANTVDRAIIASPALADLDGDGGLDVVVAGNDRHVYIWNGLGVPRPGFPVLVVDATKMASIDPVTHAVTPLPGAFRGSKIVDSPALGDIDGDGAIDIVVGTNEAYAEDPNSSGTSAALNELLTLAGQTPGNTRIYAIHKDGTAHPGGPFLAGWPVPIAILVPEILPNVGEGVNASPALADVDGDGRLEVGVFAAGGPAYLLRADGTSFYGADPSGHYRVMATEGGTSSSPDTPSVPAVGEGAFGDLIGAGQLAFAAPAAGLARLLAIVIPEQQPNADDHVAAWIASSGSYLPTFPHHIEDLQFLTGPSIADVGGAPTPEIVAASAGYFVHAYDATGTEPLGWPKFSGGWHIANPAIGDVDGDGLNEVVALTREGNLFVWDTTAPAGAAEWPKKRHDLRNTGNYEEPAGQTGNTSTTTTVAGTTTTSTTLAPCPSSPRPGCEDSAARRGKLSLRKRGGTGDQLGWKWVASAPTPKADFGSPMTSSTYVLCVYDAGGVRLGAVAPAGGSCAGRPCWRETSAGFKYADRARTPDGLTGIRLKAGDAGHGQIAVKGKGPNLRMPTLGLATPVTVQLGRSDGTACFEARFGAPTTNQADRFVARSD
jgi:hypothetical protein